jgi:hypothetical protein
LRYGHQWWWPYLKTSGSEAGPVMTFAQFRRAPARARQVPRPWCPQCGTRALPVLYGRPMPAALDLAKAGEAILGGCTAGPSSPRWSCPGCYAAFGQLSGVGG